MTPIETPKFKNKYAIQSSRLPGYDYAQNGLYFVTICTKNREEFFGIIENGKMVLNGIGEIVQDELLKTPRIRKNVNLDQWIIMPNHLHIIIEIYNTDAYCRDALQCVSTGDMQYKNKFGPQINNLSSIIRGFKGIVTKRVHICGFDYFAWQFRFYDHIIRNDESLNKIREYIINNPAMWERDRNNMENIFM
jgi:REP element-mobilizing transposase RayT